MCGHCGCEDTGCEDTVDVRTLDSLLTFFLLFFVWFHFSSVKLFMNHSAAVTSLPVSVR